MGSREGRAAALFLVVATLARSAAAGPTAAGPTAADRETARTLMDEGRALRDHHDAKRALDRFSRADALMHVPSTGYEVAATQVALGLLVEARDTLAAVRAIPSAPSEPRPFKEARKRAAELDDSLAERIPALTITVQGAAEGATPTVTIDDAPVPPAALGVPRAVNPGHHVVVGKAGGTEGRQEVDVTEGQKKDVVVSLSAAPPVEPVVAAEPGHAPGASHTLLYGSIVVGGVGVVGIVTGVVTGIVTLSDKGSLTTACGPSHQCPPSSFGTLDSANTMATVSTVALIAGTVCAAAGVTGFVLAKRASHTDDVPRPDVTAWVGPGSVGIAGHF